jgi:RND superfamily putative drug exporter
MSFVLGDLRVLKLLGLGLATAIFIDATIVRMVLVPATMELLGNANWWLPKWLDRIVPRISVEAPPDLVAASRAGAGVEPDRAAPVTTGGRRARP